MTIDSLFAPPETHTMREHCPQCGSLQGVIVPRGMQDTVRCAECDTWVYNAPRKETGKPIPRQPVRMASNPRRDMKSCAGRITLANYVINMLR